MKTALLICLLAVVRVGAGETNTLGPEPTYEGKPVSYWLGGFTHRCHAYFNVDKAKAIKAVRELGMKATPFIIRYSHTFGIRAGLTNQLDTSEIINGAFSYFSEEDKDEIEKLVPIWLSAENPQIRANALCLAPEEWMGKTIRQRTLTDNLWQALWFNARFDPDMRVRMATEVVSSRFQYWRRQGREPRDTSASQGRGPLDPRP
jgi:hypothetical protein